MTEPGTEIKTGVFVLIGVAIIMLTIFILGSDQGLLKSYKQFHVKFPSTQGLAEGSVVSLSGMSIGNVDRIEFEGSVSSSETATETRALIAHINIESKYVELITQGSRASIRTQGALGDRYIFINPGAKTASPLPVGSLIQTEKSSDFLEVMAEQAGDLSSFTDLAKNLSLLVHSLNEEQRSALLVNNVSSASHNLSQLLADPNFKGTFLHFKNIMKKIDNNEGTLGALVNDPALYEKLVNLLGEEPRNKYLKPLIREAIRQNEKKD